jgi:hypothetical protein
VASIGAGGGVASMVTGGHSRRWDLTQRLGGGQGEIDPGQRLECSLHTKYTQV